MFSSGVFQTFPISGVSFFNLKIPALSPSPSPAMLLLCLPVGPHTSLYTQGTWGSRLGGTAPPMPPVRTRDNPAPLLSLRVAVAQFNY